MVETAQDTDWMVSVLKALADPNRLMIMRALGKTGLCSCSEISPESDGMCSCDIEKMTGLSQPTVSHHLSLLTRAGLVKATKIGRWVYYQRDPEAVSRLGDSLKAVLLEV